MMACPLFADRMIMASEIFVTVSLLGFTILVLWLNDVM